MTRLRRWWERGWWFHIGESELDLSRDELIAKLEAGSPAHLLDETDMSEAEFDRLWAEGTPVTVHTQPGICIKDVDPTTTVIVGNTIRGGE